MVGSDVRWFKIISWHRVRHQQSAVDGLETRVALCGRSRGLWAEAVHDLPAEGRSCETCLKIERRRGEKAEG